jgi:hypothetical protein
MTYLQFKDFRITFKRILSDSPRWQVKSILWTYQRLFMNSDTEAGGLEDRLATLVCP